MINVLIKLEDGGKLPVKKTDGAACYDCYACLKKTVIIWPFQTKIISLGIRSEFQEGYYLEVRGRSGNSTKNIQTFIGTVDSDYRGIIGAITHNAGLLPKKIKNGDRIAQIMLKKIESSEFIETYNKLSETKRGEGGFGSTGK